MTNISRSWNPYSSASWAKVLGLVHVPMFGARRTGEVKGDNAILLDGDKGSFAFSCSDHPALKTQDKSLLSWTWSSHVRHAMIVNKNQNGRIQLLQWDDPHRIHQIKLPAKQDEAIQRLRLLQNVEAPQIPDVIQRVLHAFRLIRQALSRDEPLWAVRLLNGLLLAADRVRMGEIEPKQLKTAPNFGQAIATLSQEAIDLAELAEMPRGISHQKLGVLGHFFLEPDPHTNLQLYPDLLFRHASSKLYQEAHLQIQRDRQLSFPGMGRITPPRGTIGRDIRFTPANLARALVQQALSALGNLPDRVVVLDPACGSGIFLQECLRELEAKRFSGEIESVGYDISDVSVCMSRFCLGRAAGSLSIAESDVRVHVERRDSLEEDWIHADVILMNPPFIPWGGMDDGQRDHVKSVLGDIRAGRVDIAMAFVWKAVQSLKPGGVLACVLPAAVLSAKSGLAWRERLTHEGELLMLGRFEGYRYFPTSMVETAFIVFRRKSTTAPSPSRIQIVIASEGSEDAALVALRLPETDPRRFAEDGDVEVFPVSAEERSDTNWRPLRKATYDNRRQLKARGLPIIRELFDVLQGARTGYKELFILGADALRELGKEERYFRPVAGKGTISDGQLAKLKFVFFPYGSEGLLFESEEDLQRDVPKYYDAYLLPNRERLSSRAGITYWWELVRPRTWQFERSPRILSTYFGGSGSFAFDRAGEYIVVQGHAWRWKKPLTGGQEFGQSDLPWAYLALLNSTKLEEILSWFSVPLQGGQMSLEARFLENIPIPDLSDVEAVPPDFLQKLVRLGNEIHAGRLQMIREELDAIVSKQYPAPANPNLIDRGG